MASYSQSGVKISELPAVSGSNLDSALVPVVEGTTTKKARGYMLGNIVIQSSIYGDSVFQYNGSAKVYKGIIRYKDGLYTGCIVTSINDTTFSVTAASYRIGGISYSSPLDTIQVTSNQDTNALWRVIGVDNTGNTFVLPGLPANNPAIPIPNPSTQLGCASINFPGSGGTPIVNTYITNSYNTNDSSAIRPELSYQANDTTIFLCNLRGSCLEIRLRANTTPTIYTANGTLESNRTIDADGNDFKILNANDYQVQSVFGGSTTNYMLWDAGAVDIGRFANGVGSNILLQDSTAKLKADNGDDDQYVEVRPNAITLGGSMPGGTKIFFQNLPTDPSSGSATDILRWNPTTQQVYALAGSGGSNFTAGSNIQITGTSPNFTISAQKQFNSEINTFTQNNKFARIFAGVIRPNCPGANQPITWSFIDTTTYHNWINFDSVKGAGSQIQVYFQRAKNIVSFVAVPDESLALAGVQLGASVGDSVATISPYTLRQPCGDFVGSDTGWVTTGIATSFRDYDPSTGITRFTPTLPGSRTIYNVSPETYGTQITYVGPRNYRVRRIYSGLTSSQLIAFYLVDSVNNIVTGSLATTDRVVITVPRMGTEAIPSQTSTSTGYPCDIYGGSSNIWLMAVMEMPIIGYPLDSSSVKLEWQVARQGGGNFATSYRITRATESTPNTETNIYTGSALTFTDTGLSKGTRYLYRMYATILGVESRAGYEHVKTLNE